MHLWFILRQFSAIVCFYLSLWNKLMGVSCYKLKISLEVSLYLFFWHMYRVSPILTSSFELVRLICGNIYSRSVCIYYCDQKLTGIPKIREKLNECFSLLLLFKLKCYSFDWADEVVVRVTGLLFLYGRSHFERNFIIK